MNAMTIHREDTEETLKIYFDVITTIASCLIAILFGYIGMKIASTDVFYNSTSVELLELMKATLVSLYVDRRISGF